MRQLIHPRAFTRGARAALAALAVANLAACGILPRNAVPVELMDRASIPGMPDVRAPAGRQDPAMMRDLVASFAQDPPASAAGGGVARYASLALSGGGPNGAFGAGFLYGWSATGTRPRFKIVTGVSTGALIAPFALLGPRYDAALRDFYTTNASGNIFRMLRIIPQLLVGESLADTGPLAQLIAQNVDEALLREIAQAHAQGQRLYIGTTDLDSQRFIVWNMGRIAQHGDLDLFRRVMLASASIPVAFPPVYFDVEADGRRYDEMHVDGGVAAFVFYSANVWNFAAARDAAGKAGTPADIYIIHNGQLLPNPQSTPRSLRGIASRVFESSGKSAVVGDLFRIYTVSRRENAGYHWITIPQGVQISGEEIFDPETMRRLYDLGYRMAQGPSPWYLAPPGMTPAAAGE